MEETTADGGTVEVEAEADANTWPWGGFWPSAVPPEHDGTSLHRRLNLMKTLGGRSAGRKY